MQFICEDAFIESNPEPGREEDAWVEEQSQSENGEDVSMETLRMYWEMMLKMEKSSFS